MRLFRHRLLGWVCLAGIGFLICWLVPPFMWRGLMWGQFGLDPGSQTMKLPSQAIKSKRAWKQFWWNFNSDAGFLYRAFAPSVDFSNDMVIYIQGGRNTVFGGGKVRVVGVSVDGRTMVFHYQEQPIFISCPMGVGFRPILGLVCMTESWEGPIKFERIFPVGRIPVWSDPANRALRDLPPSLPERAMIRLTELNRKNEKRAQAESVDQWEKQQNRERDQRRSRERWHYRKTVLLSIACYSFLWGVLFLCGLTLVSLLKGLHRHEAKDSSGS